MILVSNPNLAFTAANVKFNTDFLTMLTSHLSRATLLSSSKIPRNNSISSNAGSPIAVVKAVHRRPHQDPEPRTCTRTHTPNWTRRSQLSAHDLDSHHTRIRNETLKTTPTGFRMTSDQKIVTRSCTHSKSGQKGATWANDL